MEELRFQIAEALRVNGESGARAACLAVALVERIRMHFGGSRLYVPSRDQGKRIAEVLAAWRSGKGPREISKTHAVPLASVYRIIRNRSRHEVGDAFGSEDWNL